MLIAIKSQHFIVDSSKLYTLRRALVWEAILPIIGFLIGLVSVMVGLGGGFLVVPLLTLVYAFSPANAVGTSLTTILMTTAVASAYFAKQKQTYYKMGLILRQPRYPGQYSEAT